MNNEYLELENRELWITPSSLGIINNLWLLNDPIKTDDERNNYFNFSANRKHWNPREISEIQSGKPRNKIIKLLKISVLFPQPIRYHVIGSLQSCMSITWDVWLLVPLLVRCVVYLQFTPTVFSCDWIAFLKSASSFDFEQWKKRSQRMKRNRHRQ